MTDPLLTPAKFAPVSTGSPGRATPVATASGAQLGFAQSVPFITAVATALKALVAFSNAGFVALVLAVTALEAVKKVAGPAHRLWLTIVIPNADPPNKADLSDTGPIGSFGGVLPRTAVVMSAAKSLLAWHRQREQQPVANVR